jgi:hypothetical protein
VFAAAGELPTRNRMRTRAQRHVRALRRPLL